MKSTIYPLVLLLALVSCNDSKQTYPLNVMTFNIRLNTASDSINAWPNRKEVAASMIKFYDVDVLGTQEVLQDQLDDLCARLPEYAFSGVGREDGKQKGEYSAVFYKKDRFALLNNGNFWLSEDPTAVGKKGWDAACERIVSWVHLQDKSSGKDFFFFNTHFDHIGVEARKNSSALILVKVAEIAGNKPTIVTGDFNSTPDSGVYTDITKLDDANHLTDSKQLAVVKHGTKSSFHNFGRIAPADRTLIDYVFVKNIDKVNRYGIIAEKVDDVFITDHNPVLVSLELNE